MSQSDLMRTFLIGSASGTISTVLCQPLDVLKTQIQSSRNQNKKTGYIKVSRSILGKYGVTGFWRGLTPSLVRCIPGVGLYFTTLNFLSTHVAKDPSAVVTVLMGAVARSSTTVILIPFTMLKTRFESGEYKYTSILHAMRSIREKDGYIGLTRGLGPTLMRDVPFSGLYYMFYTQIKELAGITAADSNYSWKIFATGVGASCLACVITHPADVIKTYTQLYPKQFSTFYSEITLIYSRFGIRGYFNGLLIRLIRRTLVTSTTWTLFENLNLSLRVR